MIRVLHVVSSLGVGSGIMSCLMNYYRFIDRTKVQFDFLSFRTTENTYEDEINRLGGRIYHCAKPSPFGGFAHEVEVFFAKHEGQYQIMHCHPIYCTAFFAAPAKRHGVKHVIQHSHTTKFSSKRPSALRNWVVNTLYGRRATDYAACSEEAKAVFWWKKPADVTLIPNAIDYERFRFSREARNRIRKELGIGEDELVLGHVGRFSPEKNHSFLLNVFDVFCRQNPGTKLLLVGDGPLMTQVQQQAKGLPCGKNIIFAGRHVNVEDYYSAMDIFLLPSLFEGLGIVLVEAQASGLPCVASDAVPCMAIISKKARLLPLEGNTLNWVKQIDQMNLGNREIIHSEKLDIKIQAERLRNYYKGLEQ